MLWVLSTWLRYYFRRYLPSNIALDAIRTRRGLKWGIPAMLLAAPYLLIVQVCTTVIDNGGPGYLNLVILVAAWSTLKFILIGPWSLVLLVRARLAEASRRRRAAPTCSTPRCAKPFTTDQPPLVVTANSTHSG
jgi:hypothetical protein